MAVTRIDVSTFLSFEFKYPVIDVRSEGEFSQAHIPGAVSIPIFNNEERRVVGTAYKQQSKQQAIKLGLGLFGNKMVETIETVENLLNLTGDDYALNSKTVVVYCWRGGMRSGGIGWLLDLYGFKVYTIVGGYKSFRKWCVEQFTKDYPFKVVAGFTGSGKSYVLPEMKKMGQVVIDLEDLAKHKGSAFGNIGMPEQPSQEMFENLFALELFKAASAVEHLKAKEGAVLTQAGRSNELSLNYGGLKEGEVPIWIEDESQRIGLVNIPTPFFDMMRNKPIYFLKVPFEERLKHILTGYGKGDTEDLVGAIARIEKRLGGLETKMAIKYVREGNLEEGSRILLKYYDKQYLKGLHKRENLNELLREIDCDAVEPLENARRIIRKQKEE